MYFVIFLDIEQEDLSTTYYKRNSSFKTALSALGEATESKVSFKIINFINACNHLS